MLAAACVTANRPFEFGRRLDSAEVLRPGRARSVPQLRFCNDAARVHSVNFTMRNESCLAGKVFGPRPFWPQRA